MTEEEIYKTAWRESQGQPVEARMLDPKALDAAANVFTSEQRSEQHLDAAERIIAAYLHTLPQEPSSASMGVVKAAEAKLSAYAFDEDDETEFSREDAVFILHALASLAQGEPAQGVSAKAVLRVDDKWAVEYDPSNNDRPGRVLRYGEPVAGGSSDWKNDTVAMFYALLERDAALTAAIGAGGQAVAPSISPTPVQETAWCQPMKNGEHQPRTFIVYFEDADVGVAVFDNEADARAHWERCNTNWNCYLFGALPLSPAPQAPEVSEAMVEAYKSAFDAEMQRFTVATEYAHLNPGREATRKGLEAALAIAPSV